MRRKYILCNPDEEKIEVLNARYDFITTIKLSELRPLLSSTQKVKLNRYLKSKDDFISLVFKEI